MANVYNAFGITIRPRAGVEKGSDLEEFILAHAMKCKYALVVSEKTGLERHIHMGIFLDKPVRKDNLIRKYVSYMEKQKFEREETIIMKSGIKIIYNWDFVNKYLTKGDDTEMLFNSIPNDIEEEWVFVNIDHEKALNINRKFKDVWDIVLDEFKSRWKFGWAFKPEQVQFQRARQVMRRSYLHCMFKVRTIPIIIDPKRREWYINCLYMLETAQFWEEERI